MSDSGWLRIVDFVLDLWGLERPSKRPAMERSMALPTLYDEAVERQRSRYAELRGAIARCLYLREKLRSSVGEQQTSAHVARARARDAYERGDLVASRRWVSETRVWLERAEAGERELRQLDLEAQSALDSLRELGSQLVDLEQERLRARSLQGRAALATLGRRPDASWPMELDSLRADLDRLEAERELDRDLGLAS